MENVAAKWLKKRVLYAFSHVALSFFTGDMSGDLFRCRVPCPAVERRMSFEVPGDVGSPEVHPEANLHHRPDSGLGLDCGPGVGVKWSGLRYLSHSRHSLLTDTQNASR